MDRQDVNPEDAVVDDISASPDQSNDQSVTDDEDISKVLQSQEEEEIEKVKEEIVKEQVQKPQGKKPIQKRIDTLTRQKYELKNELEEFKQRVSEYQKYLDQFIQSGQITLATQNLPESKPKRPKLEDFDYDPEAFYKALDEYEKNLIEWQKREVMQANQIQMAQNQRRAIAEQKLAPGVRKYSDFIETIVPVSHLFADHVAEAVLESDIAPDLAYYLGKNPNLILSLSAMPPVQAVREIVRLENQLKTKMEQSKKSISSAPEPISPVSGKQSSPPKDPSKMSVEEYIAWRRKQRFG